MAWTNLALSEIKKPALYKVYHTQFYPHMPTSMISIRMEANRPLWDRNPNTYNLILERPQNDLDLGITLTLMIILILYSKRIWGPTVRMINFTSDLDLGTQT